jgi:hypothetical protein
MLGMRRRNEKTTAKGAEDVPIYGSLFVYASLYGDLFASGDASPRLQDAGLRIRTGPGV